MHEQLYRVPEDAAAVPGEVHMKVDGLGRPPREYIWCAEPLPTVVFGRTQPKGKLSYADGVTYTGMVDGHSPHIGTVDQTNGTFTLDTGEIYPLPGNGEPTPVSSVAKVIKTPQPDGGVSIDMTIIAFRRF